MTKEAQRLAIAEMDKARWKALKFVYSWLWKSKDRKTINCEWPREYVNDAVSMMIEFKNRKKP